MSMILTGLTISLSSCSNTQNEIEIVTFEDIAEPIQYIEIEEPVIEEEIKEEIDTDSIIYNTEYIQVVVCDTKTPINNNMNDKIGNFVPNRCFNLLLFT